MLVAMALDLDESGQPENDEGILVIGLELADFKLLLASQGDTFLIPLSDVGAPALKGWSIHLLGPVSTERWQAEQRPAPPPSNGNGR